MKDKLIQIRADAEFLSKLEYLQLINGFKNTSETIRKIAEKEWRKETDTMLNEGEWIKCEHGWHRCSRCNCVGEKSHKFCHNCGAKMKNFY